MNKKVLRMTMIALSTAIVTIMTMVIMIPVAQVGFVNVGDTGVLFFASLFNPPIAFFIGGVGSALADILGGYAHYAIATLIIKGLEGFVVSYLFHKIKGNMKYTTYILGVIIMIVGYGLFNLLTTNSFASMMASIIGNLGQAGVCLVLAFILRGALSSILEKNKSLFE